MYSVAVSSMELPFFSSFVCPVFVCFPRGSIMVEPQAGSRDRRVESRSNGPRPPSSHWSSCASNVTASSASSSARLHFSVPVEPDSSAAARMICVSDITCTLRARTGRRGTMKKTNERDSKKTERVIVAVIIFENEYPQAEKERENVYYTTAQSVEEGNECKAC